MYGTLPSIKSEELPKNDGLQTADVSTAPTNSSGAIWTPLGGGEFARGSVVPPGNFDREVKLCFNAARNNTQEMIFGCEESDFQGNFNNTLVILYRGKCKFEDKITNANKANAAGVIVINNNPTGVITMSIGDADQFNLVSIMINHNDGLSLLDKFKQENPESNREQPLYARITKGQPAVGFEKVIVIVICLAFLVLLTISLAWVIFYYVQRFRLLHRQYTAQKQQEKLMRKALDNLRVETLKPSSDLVKNHEETCCAICIDNFEAGVQVRHLTCGHPYHKKCIDPWLMEKGTCPQCKVDVLKQLGLRDSDSFAEPPAPTTDTMETNEAFYDEETHQTNQNDEMNDSGMEDEEDGEVSSDLPIDVVSCNNNNCNWTISHSQLDRAMSEPLPPVDQINVGIRGTLFQHSRLTTENEVEEPAPRTEL